MRGAADVDYFTEPFLWIGRRQARRDICGIRYDRGHHHRRRRGQRHVSRTSAAGDFQHGRQRDLKSSLCNPHRALDEDAYDFLGRSLPLEVTV